MELIYLAGLNAAYAIVLSFLGNFNNPIWDVVKYIADYVPGGKYYYLVAHKNKLDCKVNEWYKNFQSFCNADRFEYILHILFPNAKWKNEGIGFHPGVGLNDADFVDENGVGFDAKVYYNINTMYENTVNLFINKKGLQQDEWAKKINDLFHTPGEYLMAYDDERKVLYKIDRPVRVLTYDEAVASVHKTDIKVPNVIAKDGQYVIDDKSDFKLLFINETADGMKFWYR